MLNQVCYYFFFIPFLKKYYLKLITKNYKKIMCDKTIKRKFSEYTGLTTTGKKKVDCWSGKNIQKPNEVAYSSGKKFWFQCNICSHDFESNLDKVSHGRWCPYCCIPTKKLCNKGNCNYCFNKSFASYNGLTNLGEKKVNCWSNKNKLKPINIKLCSGQKFIFNCDVCHHEFESQISKVINNRWCPYCCIPSRKKCNIENCNNCFIRSFESYNELTIFGKKKIDCWSNKNKLKPKEISKNCQKKFWFNCDKCPHEFESRIDNIVNNNSWCPYCCIPTRKLCNKQDCDYCFNKSFASYTGLTNLGEKKVNFWSNKNKLKPREYLKQSNIKIWFNCDKCPHTFDITLSNIIYGKWCPKCKESKGEQKITEYINKLGYNNNPQIRFKNCYDKQPLPFDNAIISTNTNLNILIEYDGEQHFNSISFFGGEKGYKKRVKHDILKNKFCLENNYILLRIAYTEIDYIPLLIDKAIEASRKNKPIIIYSNPKLYKTTYINCK